MKTNIVKTVTGIYVTDVDENEIRVREKRARGYLTRKEMERRWKKEVRQKIWAEILGGILIWALALLIITCA